MVFFLTRMGKNSAANLNHYEFEQITQMLIKKTVGISDA